MKKNIFLLITIFTLIGHEGFASTQTDEAYTTNNQNNKKCFSYLFSFFGKKSGYQNVTSELSLAKEEDNNPFVQFYEERKKHNRWPPNVTAESIQYNLEKYYYNKDLFEARACRFYIPPEKADKMFIYVHKLAGTNYEEKEREEEELLQSSEGSKERNEVDESTPSKTSTTGDNISGEDYPQLLRKKDEHIQELQKKIADLESQLKSQVAGRSEEEIQLLTSEQTYEGFKEKSQKEGSFQTTSHLSAVPEAVGSSDFPASLVEKSTPTQEETPVDLSKKKSDEVAQEAKQSVNEGNITSRFLIIGKEKEVDQKEDPLQTISLSSAALKPVSSTDFPDSLGEKTTSTQEKTPEDPSKINQKIKPYTSVVVLSSAKMLPSFLEELSKKALHGDKNAIEKLAGEATAKRNKEAVQELSKAIQSLSSEIEHGNKGAKESFFVAVQGLSKAVLPFSWAAEHNDKRALEGLFSVVEGLSGAVEGLSREVEQGDKEAIQRLSLVIVDLYKSLSVVSKAAEKGGQRELFLEAIQAANQGIYKAVTSLSQSLSGLFLKVREGDQNAIAGLSLVMQGLSKAAEQGKREAIQGLSKATQELSKIVLKLSSDFEHGNNEALNSLFWAVPGLCEALQGLLLRKDTLENSEIFESFNEGIRALSQEEKRGNQDAITGLAKLIRMLHATTRIEKPLS